MTMDGRRRARTCENTTHNISRGPASTTTLDDGGECFVLFRQGAHFFFLIAVKIPSDHRFGGPHTTPNTSERHYSLSLSPPLKYPLASSRLGTSIEANERSIPAKYEVGKIRSGCQKLIAVNRLHYWVHRTGTGDCRPN